MTQPEASNASATSGLNLSPFCINLRSKKLFFGSVPPMEEDEILDGSGWIAARADGQATGGRYRLAKDRSSHLRRDNHDWRG